MKKKKYDVWISYTSFNKREYKDRNEIPLRENSYKRLCSFCGKICQRLSIEVKSIDDDSSNEYFANMRGLARFNARYYKVYTRIIVSASHSPKTEIKEILQNYLKEQTEYELARWGCSDIPFEEIKVLDKAPKIDTKIWCHYGSFWRASWYSELFTDEEWIKLQKWHNKMIETFGNGNGHDIRLAHPSFYNGTDEVDIYKKELEGNQPLYDEMRDLVWCSLRSHRHFER